MKGVRLVLSEHLPVNELDSFAKAWGWVPQGLPQSLPNGGITVKWKSLRSSVTIRYVDDQELDLRFLEITGEGTEDVTSWVILLLPVRSQDDMDAMVRSVTDPASWIELMSLAGIMGSLAFDPERFLILGNGLAHFDPQVRLAALRAVAYLDWPSFDEALREIAESDPDDAVRSTAAWLLLAKSEEK